MVWDFFRRKKNESSGPEVVVANMNLEKEESSNSSAGLPSGAKGRMVKTAVLVGLPLVLIAIGLVIGLVLVRQEQDIRSRAACDPTQSWPRSPSPGDGATDVSLTPTFRWDQDVRGPGGYYANVYLWDCPEATDSCLVGFGHRESNTARISQMPASEIHPYAAVGRPDYGRSVAPLAADKKYWWYVTPAVCSVVHFEEGQRWAFTTTSAPVRYKECRQLACVEVEGAGTDNCSANSDCFHLACSADKTCVKVAGKGSDECATDANCVPATYSFRVCENNACVTKQCSPARAPCAKDTDCKADADCKGLYKHKVCLGQSCTLVDCSPPTVKCEDLCSNDSVCRTPPPPPLPTESAHRECRNNACVTVAGEGADKCTSDVSCRTVATPPPIPPAGSVALTVGGLVVGIGAFLLGLLLVL